MTLTRNFSRSQRQRALTLVEVLITMVTSVVVMGGALAAYIYGLKMVQITQPKLSASDDARKAVALFTEDVRTAVDVKLGTMTGGTFQRLAPFSLQTGDAVRIHPSADTNRYIIYFWDNSDKSLKRTTNNTTFTAIIANAVSNEVVFTSEDFKGNIHTNSVNNAVIGMTLQFYQLQYPRTAVGAGGLYDWYQLRTKVTKRNPF
jgi:type II secretory pathway pseudopilin PulG